MPLIRLHELKRSTDGPASSREVIVNSDQIQIGRPVARGAGSTVIMLSGPTVDVAETLEQIETMATIAERFAR